MTGAEDLTLWLTMGPVLLGVGAIAGVLAGLLGVGGGIVIVPVLYALSGVMGVSDAVAIKFAIATSLATIIPTSISSSRAHRRKGSVDMTMFRSWAPFIFVGAGLGGFAAAAASSSALQAVFGTVALLVALNMLRRNAMALADAPPTGLPGRAAIAVPIGGFSAMMGIGGGTLSVPILTLLSFPVHRAVGTAALFGLVIAVPGIVGYALAGQDIEGLPPGSLGYINLPAAALISLATFLCAPLGARLAHWLSPPRLRLAFAVFLGISAIQMLWEAAASV